MLTGKQTFYLYVNNIDITRQEIELELLAFISKALMDGREYTFKSGNLLFEDGSFLASVEYELYLNTPKECRTNEYLVPGYFERIYEDMDTTFDCNDIAIWNEMLFQKKENESWLRIE